MVCMLVCVRRVLSVSARSLSVLVSSVFRRTAGVFLLLEEARVASPGGGTLPPVSCCCCCVGRLLRGRCWSPTPSSSESSSESLSGSLSESSSESSLSESPYGLGVWNGDQ